MNGENWIAAAFGMTGLHHLLSPSGPLLVMYHGIGGDDGLVPEVFSAQLDALTERRRVVPLAEALTLLGRAEASRVAALTFDDGYLDFAKHALPALRQRGLHATVFVPTGLLGSSNRWDAGIAKERQILSREELRRLDPSTVEIGAHGRTHCRLAGLSPDVLWSETHGARVQLEDACDRRIRFFAYPYGQLGDFDAAAEAAVAAAGFEAACSTHFGRGSRLDERFRLRRVGIDAGDDLTRARLKFDGAYDWRAWKERIAARHRKSQVLI